MNIVNILGMDTDYEISCLSCGSPISRMRLKQFMDISCKKCGLCFRLINENLESLEDFNLEIFLGKNPLSTFTDWDNIDKSEPKLNLHCPFCTTVLHRSKDDIHFYNCPECYKSYTTEYLT